MPVYYVLFTRESEMYSKSKNAISKLIQEETKRFDNSEFSQCFLYSLYIYLKRDQRERRSPLTKITHSSFPHLGKSQGSTTSQCNEAASPWRNHLDDHGLPPCQVSMLKQSSSKSNLKKISFQYLFSKIKNFNLSASYPNI